MNSENVVKTGERKRMLDQKDLRQLFFRAFRLDNSWDYERQQHIAYGYGMSSAIAKIYKDDPEKKKSALQRSLEFMACTPQLVTILFGINAAMEEENAQNPDFDGNSINAVKTSLMGPLAGIGDALIPGTLRIIAASVAISFAAQGSILAPILYLLIFNIPAIAIQWFGMQYGYKMGTRLVTDMSKSGVMNKVSYAASIVGLMAVGGMAATQIWLDLPIMVGAGEFAQPLVSYFDQIMPCLIQLGLFGGMYYLLGKKIKTTHILLGVMGVCIGICFVASLF